jgi:hypothetical protein
MTELKMDRVTERFMIAGSGLVLLAGIVALDSTIRDRVKGLLTGNAGSEMSIASAYLQRMTGSALETMRYHGAEDTMLVFFAVGAIVLLVLMVKT